MKKLVYLLTILTLCVACAPTPKDVQQSDQLPPIYPDYCEVTIPENIAPLNFLLRANCEAIEVKAGSLTIHARGNEAIFDIDDWEALMEQSAGKEIDVTITALIDGRWRQRSLCSRFRRSPPTLSQGRNWDDGRSRGRSRQLLYQKPRHLYALSLRR